MKSSRREVCFCTAWNGSQAVPFRTVRKELHVQTRSIVKRKRRGKPCGLGLIPGTFGPLSRTPKRRTCIRQGHVQGRDCGFRGGQLLHSGLQQRLCRGRVLLLCQQLRRILGRRQGAGGGGGRWRWHGSWSLDLCGACVQGGWLEGRRGGGGVRRSPDLEPRSMGRRVLRCLQALCSVRRHSRCSWG